MCKYINSKTINDIYHIGTYPIFILITSGRQWHRRSGNPREMRGAGKSSSEFRKRSMEDLLRGSGHPVYRIEKKRKAHYRSIESIRKVSRATNHGALYRSGRRRARGRIAVRPTDLFNFQKAKFFAFFLDQAAKL